MRQNKRVLFSSMAIESTICRIYRENILINRCEKRRVKPPPLWNNYRNSNPCFVESKHCRDAWRKLMADAFDGRLKFKRSFKPE